MYDPQGRSARRTDCDQAAYGYKAYLPLGVIAGWVGIVARCRSCGSQVKDPGKLVYCPGCGQAMCQKCYAKHRD